MEVDIKISLVLDRLIFVPRKIAHRNLVKKLLSSLNPEIRFIQSAEGISVNSTEVNRLNLEIDGILFNWTELARMFLRNRQRIQPQLPYVLENIKRIRDGGKQIAEDYLQNTKGLEILDDHQWVDVACMTLPNGFGLCVFDEQGSGKTVTLIFAFDVLVERNEVDFALIIAPKSMISEWPVDFSKFMSGRYKVQVLTGAQDKKKEILSNKSDVIITNFETAVTMEQELRAVLRKYNLRSIIVVDESFFTKNLDAKRTQAVRRLREYCGRAFVLCGTPAPNSPVDLIEQFNIVDFGTTFKGVALSKNKEETTKVVQKIVEERGPFVRHLKTNVLPDLPPKKFNKIVISMQPKQFELYQSISENLVSELKSIDDVEFTKSKLTFLAKRSALLQICSNPVSFDKNYNEVPAKILALDTILEDLIMKNNEKVVLWSFYTASLEGIFHRYKKYNPVRYDGSITDTTDRRNAVMRFREDDKVMLFVGNPAAAGAGLNLQSARYAIYESMSNQAAHYLQSLDRIHRRGQKREVEYIILFCDKTIEVSAYKRLIEKELTAQKLLGDPIPLITRETMISELSS